jgi:Glycosyltransferase GT-D fold/Methyltransferase domain
MKYPKILSEEQTVDAILAGNSIARYGDGEWRCAIDGACTSQRAHPKLAAELRAAMRPAGTPKYIVGIPNPFNGCPREESWVKYTEPRFSNLLDFSAPYYSSFITRPDNAPWIDTKEFWAKVGKIWAGQDVVLVVGDKKSLTSEMIESQCASFKEVYGPRQHAYSEIDRIEQQAISAARSDGRPMAMASRILMCLGATATVLAHRLAKRGYHAIDLGHIGMFMRHAGAYRYSQNDLTSMGYRSQLEKMHQKQRWGADGAKHVGPVKGLCDQVKPATILDYGCGENKLAAAMAPVRVQGYDPGIPERAKMPKPCELVVCTDVLEHVEPEKLDAVLDHMYRLTGKVAYMVICTRPANAVLIDGRNAHLVVENAAWWLDKLQRVGWDRVDMIDQGKELRVTAWK